MKITRLLAPEDAPALAELLRVNREFLEPWQPVRSEDYFTAAGQLAVIQADLDEYGQGAKLPHVILDDSSLPIGRITLSGIVYGPFQSCAMGYWVNAGHNGRGFATAAVSEIVRVAFEELGLHRVQAEILPHNTGSRRVLERNGFTRFGMAPEYLNIAGRWQDHAMYQVVNRSWAATD
ncbi:GNAT family protein [Dactylosporangium sp. NPDC005572]|uniref:GNAT family N-acetyltransferase n=1 Tax=Dactylosporangium sp. NPDC005572 TaxID=3156889 RepID=UPI0033BA98E1